MRDALAQAALLQSPLLLCALTVVIAGAGSALPFSPIEPLFLAIATAVPGPYLLPLVALATLGHMAAKALVCVASRQAGRALPARTRAAVERAGALLTRRRGARFLTLLVSAVAGVPPLYAITVAYGALRLPLRDYLIAVSIGRALRFGALVLIPHLVPGTR